VESSPLANGRPAGSTGGRSALIAAAGAGERLGRGPKAFLTLGGLTLLERAVAALSGLVDEVVVAVPRSHLGAGESLVPGARIVAGGASRQESVAILLEETSAELVLVHDVARPFLEPAVARRVIEAAARGGAASAARAVSDSLVTAAEGRTVDREGLRAVQTPQAFDRALLLRAHDAARSAALSATDDASLVRFLGAEVELVDGSPWLFKLTSPQDLAFAEALALSWDTARQVFGAKEVTSPRSHPPATGPTDEDDG
jgi:2-C-methyl-D-erythritol 4-phosphate cytidylyltransferase